MAPPARLRLPNPHLSAYYGIITSAFVSLVIALALFEQLGWQAEWLATGMIVLPLAVYVAIAAATRTADLDDFFASGRRVPPVFNGFVLAATAIGGTGFFAYTGAVYFLGFDALAIGLGWTMGLVVAAVLFAPYLRKAGAFTLPGLLGQRFGSRMLRIAASALQLPPVALLLAAELKIAAVVAALFLPLSSHLVVMLLAAVIAFIGMIGGMRSLTWSGSAEFLVGAIGFSVPLVIVAVLLTSLPAPQLTYGETFSSLEKAEIAAGISPVRGTGSETTLPGAAPQAPGKPFLNAFSAISQSDFLMLFLSVALGTAAMPSLLVRSGVTSSAAAQRYSSAWAALFVAGFVVSAPALAAFARLLMLQDVAQLHVNALPPWLLQLSANQLAFARDANGDGALHATEVFIARDAIPLVLPLAAKLPFVCTVLTATAGIGIALAAACSHLFTLGASLAEDIAGALNQNRAAIPRLLLAQFAVVTTAVATAVFVMIADFDILRAALTALAFAGATFFPVLVLALWWRRCSALGAALALCTGFVAMLVQTLLGGVIGGAQPSLTAPLASVIGAVLALIAGVAGSLLGPAPSAAEETYFDELRDPSGEAIYDRAQAALRSQVS